MLCTLSIEDHVLNTPEPSADRGQAPHALPHELAPPLPPPHLPVSIEQLLAMQNDLMRRLVENGVRRGVGHPQHPNTRIWILRTPTS
jgi:hypothetical protein